MAENPVETGQQMVERWREVATKYTGRAGDNIRAAIAKENAEEFATFLSRLRELSAKMPHSMIERGYGNMRSGEKVLEHAEPCWRCKLDALTGPAERRTDGGENG